MLQSNSPLLEGSSLAMHSYLGFSVGLRLALAWPAAILLAGEGLWERDVLLVHILLIDVGLHGPTLALHALGEGQWRSRFQLRHNMRQANGGILMFKVMSRHFVLGLTKDIDLLTSSSQCTCAVSRPAERLLCDPHIACKWLL